MAHPSTLPIGPDEPEDEAPHAFLIRIVDGRLRAPAPLVLELDEVVLARGERLEAIVEARRAIVHVDDPSLSARHARIVRAGPASFSLEDLGSTNGCRVNGVPATASHPLAGGDLLETGTSFWKLHLGPVAHRERLLELAYRSGPIEFASSVCFGMLEALWRVRQVAPTELSSSARAARARRGWRASSTSAAAAVDPSSR